MTNFNTTKQQMMDCLNQIEKYETKPTKAESARIRNSLNGIKKGITEAKRDLLTADKG